MDLDEKRRLLDELRHATSAELDAAREALKNTHEASTHPEAKPENDKDTRALELSYLERGQAARVRELEVAIEKLGRLSPRLFREGEPIALGAVVVLEDDAETMRAFVAPAGGGRKLGAPARAVVVVTPESPLGQALVGKAPGDEVEIVAGGKKRTWSVGDVA